MWNDYLNTPSGTRVATRIPIVWTPTGPLVTHLPLDPCLPSPANLDRRKGRSPTPLQSSENILLWSESGGTIRLSWISEQQLSLDLIMPLQPTSASPQCTSDNMVEILCASVWNSTLFLNICPSASYLPDYLSLSHRPYSALLRSCSCMTWIRLRNWTGGRRTLPAVKMTDTRPWSKLDLNHVAPFSFTTARPIHVRLLLFTHIHYGSKV